MICLSHSIFFHIYFILSIMSTVKPERSCRLLGASAVSIGSTLDLTLVLEYIDQDLSTFLSKAPACGLSRDMIKVRAAGLFLLKRCSF